MKMRFYSLFCAICFFILQLVPSRYAYAYSIEFENNNDNIDQSYINNEISNTFDIKKVIPEIVVIIVAGGILLFCISKE